MNGDIDIICETCEGTGSMKEPCTTCGGAGRLDGHEYMAFISGHKTESRDAENTSLRAEVERLKKILSQGLQELENSHGWDCTHGCNSNCPCYEKCTLRVTLEVMRKAATS